MQYNIALAGQALSGMVPAAAGRVDPLLGSGLNVLCVAAGVNDLNGGDSAATVFNNLNTYCAARKSAGWDKIVVLTILPFTSDGATEAKRLALNTLIRNAISPSTYDYVADVGGDPTIGDTGDNFNTFYYGGDALHPQSPGYTIMAGIVKTQLAFAGIS